MKKRAVLVTALAALLAVPGMAYADTPGTPVTIVADMLSTAEGYIGLVDDYPYMYLHPTGIADLFAFATADGHGGVYSDYENDRTNPNNIQEACDNNGNGIPDAAEMKVLEDIINNHGGAGDPLAALHAAVHEGYKQNVAQLSTIGNSGTGDLGGLAGSLAPLLKNIMAAYASLGDGGYQEFVYGGVRYGYGAVGSFGVVADTIGGMADYGSAWNAGAPAVANYSMLPDLVSGCGDADGDGVANTNEYYAAANDTAYVAAALSAATTTSAPDPNDYCSQAPGGFAFGDNLYYNPANGSVYANLGDMPWPVGESLAEAFSLAGTDIPGTLVHIEDDAENTWVNTNITAVINDSIWIGATDQAAEGVWKWIDTGAQFWQGAAAGTVVGGLYNHWNGGEPNDSGGEDYAEMNVGGGWNDNGVSDTKFAIVEFTNGGAGYEDANSDGVPEFWAALLNLTDIQIAGAPSGQLAVDVPGQNSALLTASSSDAGDTAFTWESSDETVATVASLNDTQALVTAVGPGEAVITATANTTGASNTVAISVRAAEWFEVCPLVAVFPAEGAVLADAVGPGPEYYAVMDLEGDGVPDAWQLQLLAYDICANPASTAAAEYAQNQIDVAQMGADLTAVAGWLGTGGADGQLIYLGLVTYAAGSALGGSASEQATLASIFDASMPGMGSTIVELLLAYPLVNGSVMSEMPDVQGDLATYGPAIQYVLSHVLAGLIGLDTELNVGIPMLLSLPDLEFMLDATSPAFLTNLTDVGGGLMVPTPLLLGDLEGLLAMPLFPVMDLGAQTEMYLLGLVQAYLDGTYGPGTFNAMLPNSAGLLSAMTAFETKYQELGSNSFAIPDLEVYTVGAKLPDEPFSGLGDYDGDGVTNQQVAEIILGQGGDANDFVNGAANIDPFWAGNPALPVAGMAGLCALAMALGGTTLLRRKK